MRGAPADDLINRTLSQFKIRRQGYLDVREALALIDFNVRIVYTLAILHRRRNQGDAIQLLPAPGFGSMLAVIRKVSREQPQSGAAWAAHMLYAWCGDVIKAVDQFKVPNKYKTLKSLRDRLSHGSTLPSDDATLTATTAAIESLLSSFASSLSRHMADVVLEESEGRLYLFKRSEVDGLDVSPLWIVREEELGVGIYSHFASDGIFYIAPDGDIWSELSHEPIARFRRLFISEKGDASRELARLVADVLQDIAAYTEDYSRPGYYFGDEQDAGYLFVPWTRSTSDGNDPRIDAFRIGPDSRKEWRHDDSWHPYSKFLKQISNWELLARRIKIGLDSVHSRREAEESSRLGSSSGSDVRGPSILKEMDESLAGDGGTDSPVLFEMSARVDDACQRMKPSTAVFFLVGQAGLGKTELMLSLARQRAASIAAAPNENVPLYLFVSSTGRTLSSLEDAVDGALNITKLLSSHSAKALCRNGLLVLMVDGFDELLGSSGYENALGSLEPWFRELGGRGVLVASARSSYYLTQYRRSLAKAGDLNVDHTLVELQPWTRSESEAYLANMGVGAGVLKSIKNSDWSVLRIPFFAKALAAWVDVNAGESRPVPSMFDIVVEQFLNREAVKLHDPSVGELLTASELRDLFADVAELMQGSKNREIEQSDLVSCAQMVVGASSLDDARPGLSRRLSSLCGLGVRSDSSGQSQFGFSHEVLFDCFLSLAIKERLGGVFNESSFIKLIGASNINPSVFEWLVEKVGVAIGAGLSKISFDLHGKDASGVLSSNLGLLWEAILESSGGVPPTSSARGLVMRTIRLADQGWTSLDLSGSSIEHLFIPANSAGGIDIAGADISLLEVETAAQARRCLKGVESSSIASILIGESFADRPSQVAEELHRLGLVSLEAVVQDDEVHAAAEYYLSRLKRRADVPVILDRDDKTVDDQRLSWVGHFDATLWSRFVTALIESDVARFETLPTSGRPKARLSFNVPIGAVIDRSSERPEVERFWHRL